MNLEEAKILQITKKVNQEERRGLIHSNVQRCPLAESFTHLEAQGFIRFQGGLVWITEDGLAALATWEDQDAGPESDAMNDGLGPLPPGMQ